MSASEFKLRKLLEDSTFYIKNAEEDETFLIKCNTCMDEAESIILANPRESLYGLSPEVIVMYIEVALLTNRRDESASRVTDIFFQRIKQEDQFFCRALLAKASIEERKIKAGEMKGDNNIKQINHSFSFIRRAIEIAAKPENKTKYQFIVYNASIKTWHIIRGCLRRGWSKALVEILEKISNLLEEVDDFDFNWRCRYLNALTKAMLDAEKKPEALKVLDKLVDLTKKKGNCNFQEVLYRNRIHYNKETAAVLANIKKENETGEDPMGLKYLFVIQNIKSGVIPDAQIEKELQTVMMSIAPQSINSTDSDSSQISKLTPIMIDRLAECGRCCVKQGIIIYAEGATSVVARASQGSLRAQIWTEYTKAELLLRKPSADVDTKTGMKLNTLQRQIQDFDRRIEALKIMDRAMIANKRLADPELIIEGCYIIWNMSLPLLKNSSRTHTYKPFISASQALESINANDNQLRVNLHLELAKYEIRQDFLSKAVQQLKKCLDIDYSKTLKEVGFEMTEDDDPANFQRPQDKIIKFLMKKLELKTNLYGGDPETVQEQIILDVENAKTTRNQKMRETLLDKALKALQEFEEPEYIVDPERDLVEQEITKEKKLFHLKNIKEAKQRVLISTEMAKLAYEENLIDLAYDAATLAVKDEWDPIKDNDLIMAQSESHAILAKCYVEYLLEDDIEIGHKELVTLQDDQDDRDFTNEDRARYQEWKTKFTEHVIKAIKLGSQSQQTWLIFNGVLEFWNNYLPIFKLNNFYDKILDLGVPCMIEAFEAMNNCFENAVFSHENVDYELSKKMNIFSNVSIMLARMNEFLHKNDDAVRICDVLLQKQLPSHLRKTFDSIKARVTKQVSQAGAPAGKAAPPKGKGEVAAPVVEVSKADIVSSEVLGYLELIKGGNKDMIHKAMEALAVWTPQESEEIELELNAELWCRLGRTAIEQKTNAFTKVALYCAEMAIHNADKKIKNKQYMLIPVTRLRWYSVSECLYGEALNNLLDTKKQEKESQDKLLHASVSHFVESCNIASKAGIGYLLIESCKCMWNALLGVLDAPYNRKLLIKPLCSVHQYLRDAQETSDPDFLSLLYSAMFLCISEQQDWKLGEKIVEEAFQYVPSSHHKVLWEAKMNFLSKLGKNVLSAISNMKESNASLMAKVWVKLARSSAQDLEQHSAYNKAIEILRKEESVEVVEVLIEYAEWMQRKKCASQDVEDQLLLAVDILMDVEPGWDEDDEETNEDGEDDRKTRKTGKSKSSKFSKGSKATKKTKASKVGKSVKKSAVGAKSKMSNASKRSKSMRSGGSRASKKTKTALSQRMEEDGQPMFLNCSHFEKLVRVHSMLASIAHDSTKQREYALDAHFFIMKMWEQSYQCLNATLFFEKHKKEIEELGFSVADPESRQQYFHEVITSNELGIPVYHALPEKPEDWVQFKVPAEFISKAAVNEDKIMISKIAFMKPELTLYHIQNVLKLLEEHYFSMQQLPVLHLLQLFSQEVMGDKILVEVSELKRARLMMNLGLKDASNRLIEDLTPRSYQLTEEEKKVNFEQIKALRDPSDDMKTKYVPFLPQNDQTPFVLELIRIHESWLQLGEEHIKWGNYVKAKELLKEVNIHSRILKDQPNYAASLLSLSTIAYLEGESGSALKLDMLCHNYAIDMEFVEKAIIHTNDLLMEFGKIDDCRSLLDGSIQMIMDIKQNGGAAAHQKSVSDNKKSTSSISSQPQNNLPLDYALSTCYLLKAILNIKEISKLGSIEEQEPICQASFDYIDKFDAQLLQTGCKQSHLIRLLQYSNILQSQITSQMKQVTLKSAEFAKFKLEKCAKILLKVQEMLTDQMYYIGIHQDSNSSSISLPLTRLLGVVKIRLAQINTDIGVIKNQIKAGAPGAQGGPVGSIEEKKKLDKVVATFMDAVTKQIEAQANTYSKEMNRYEKSITMLQSALNMIHKDCLENAECLVEIARNKRLLAVNKKHLRGQWRQDAIQVDEVSLNQSLINEGMDRNDMLGDKGLDGEVADLFVDYKEEALKAFINIIEQSKSNKSNEPPKAAEPVAAKGGKDAPPEEEAGPPKYTSFTQLLESIGSNRLDNILATFALEYAESRGNLNPEQAFYHLAVYQYALSRQNIFQTYMKATTEKHPDIQRLRQMERIQRDFSFFTTPFLPKSYYECKEKLKNTSKPMKIIHHFAQLEEMKENLPHSAAYLILQLSDDEQHIFCGLMTINNMRKINYFVSKLNLPGQDRETLFKIISTLAQNKLTMQKAPITIIEDLENLEKDSNEEITKMLEQLEAFFEPITSQLEPLINPGLNLNDSVEEDPAQAAAGKGGKADPKKDDKKAAKAPPPKGKGGGAEAQLASYESNLPLTSSGIESLVLILDHKLESLPLESLQLFRDVPVLSRDFNLHLYMERLKSLGHQAELHNNKGISKEKLGYIIDPPSSLNEKATKLVDQEMIRMQNGVQWKGILTNKQHSPSSGEWQECIAKSDMFAYYSMTCLLHKFPPSLVADLSIFSQCKAMIIFDRMNSFKTLVDRDVVTSKHFVPSEQPMQEAVLFSLCGVKTIITNHWSTKPENNLELFETLLRGSLTDGLYLGASLKKYWGQEDAQAKNLESSDPVKQEYLKKSINLFKHNSVTYGVPIVRII